MTIRKGTATGLGLAVTLLVSVTAAYAQDGAPQQTLDRVEAMGTSTVLEMTFNDPARTVDFFDTGAAALQSFAHCALTGSKGRFCLDGRLVRRWSDPTDATTVATEFSCADRALGLNTQAQKVTCSALAAGLPGNVVISGLTPNNSYRLIEVFPKGAGCPTGSSALTGVTDQDTSNFGNYCFRTLAANRTLMTDLVVIDGSVGADYPPGPGVLALETGNSVVFFPKLGAPITIASGKTAWGLTGNEALLSAALFQHGDPVENYVLATTTTGRIMKKSTNNAVAAVPVFNIPNERVLEPGESQCSTSTQRYWIRTKSAIAIATDQNFCQVIALTPDGPSFGSLVNVPEGTKDLTLSTRASSTEFTPPLAPSIAPGITVDLTEDCGVGNSCPFTLNSAGEPTSTLSNVVLDPSTTNSLMTVIMIEGLPDCRQIPNDSWCQEKFAEEGQPLPDGRTGQPVIVTAGGREWLNVAALFPQVVHDMVLPEVLPPMLVQPLHRADPNGPSANHFKGFFGITDPSVVFRGNFDFVVDVGELTNSPSACGLGGPHPNLAWDLVTAVSGRATTVAGPLNNGTVEFVDMLLNTDCFNPTSTKGGTRWSFYAIDLRPTEAGDAVYAKLLDSLFTDLESTRAQLLCSDADVEPGEAPPLSSSVCSSLLSRWGNAKAKLVDCLAGATFPKQSQAINNCNAFLTQLLNYQSTLLAAPRVGQDPFNRIGEQRGRVEVLLHVYEDHFLPSIPAQGFCDLPGAGVCPAQ